MSKDERNIYIANLAPEEAKKLYLGRLGNLKKIETIDVRKSVGRITACAVLARVSSPSYNASAMDGIAVWSENTAGTTEVTPSFLEEKTDFIYVNTGDPIPPQYNAVIMIEDIIKQGERKIKIIAPSVPWQNIRPVGEDIVEGEMVLPSGYQVRPMDIGALFSAGIEMLTVYKMPKVGIIPTGSELIENISELRPGKILESNSHVMAAAICEYGGIPERYPPCEDDYTKLKQVVMKGLEENDLLLINAGSSAGTKDFTLKLIKELGEVVVHGLALKPGKPAILGLIADKPVIGIPGYPVSSYLIFEIFVKPVIFLMLGKQEEAPSTVRAIISKRMVSSFKNKELIRVTLGKVGERLIATPLSREAGSTMSLIRADGLLEIPRNYEGIEAGEEWEIKLWRSLSHISGKLVAIGSHDLILDIVADMMPFSSGHVGSMGGIMAMKRKECHLAPIHLLDEKTGEYNVPFIRKYFSDQSMCIIRGVERFQGFMVARGNPLQIHDFWGLTQSGVRFVNRQRGSGTRLLLDYHLAKSGIQPQQIQGYDREMTTHMAVAASIQSGSADVGVGISSAARAMGLDFIIVDFEQYDFLTTPAYLEENRMKEFLSVLKSSEFQKRVLALVGYKITGIGEIIKIESSL